MAGLFRRRREARTGPADRLRRLDDADLVAALARGDTEALDGLVARHGSRVCRYLDRILLDGGWADDVAQEVFVRVYERPDAYDPRWPVAVWLFTIARNLAVDLMRREGRLRDRLAELPPRPDQPAADHDVERRELLARLDQAVAALPETYRSVFLLREHEGLSYEEIGAVLDISVKTVSSRLHRARSELRSRLEEFLCT